MPAFRRGVLTATLVVAGCSTLPRPPSTAIRDVDHRPPVVVYVVRRGWHTDIGFAAGGLGPPLTLLGRRLPGARYLLFGFGDRHYLMSRGHSAAGLLGAILPGAGIILVTGLTGTPEEAFGADHVRRLTVTAQQAQALEDFVQRSLARQGAKPEELGAGPYAGSLYYSATVAYSGLHTCNTWTAEGLQSAGLPIHSFGVEFAGQIWQQVRHVGGP